MKSHDNFDEINQIRGLVNRCDVLVLDGYDFEFNYQKLIHKHVKKLVFIDDFRNSKISCDILINHGTKDVKKREKISYFVGLQYLILRSEFLNAAKLKNSYFKNNAFVCFGGSDPFNITHRLLKSIAGGNSFDNIFVLIGAANVNKDFLFEKYKNTNVKFFENSSSLEIVKLLNLSNIAFSTSSTVALEVCCTKTPLICGYINSNQKAIDKSIIKEGCGISIGNWKYSSLKQIKKLIEVINIDKIRLEIIRNQILKIDGLSRERYLLMFKQIFDEK
jgi:spore coat polysaccharide biosynthesis predicted glycosyltransferase SpsG